MNLAPHLPALQVVVPLIAAPLTVLLRQRSVAFAVALVASWLALAISLLLWWQVANDRHHSATPSVRSAGTRGARRGTR